MIVAIIVGVVLLIYFFLLPFGLLCYMSWHWPKSTENDEE